MADLDFAREFFINSRPQFAVTRIEVGTAAWDRLKANYRPEGAPPDSPYIPPPLWGSLIGLPVAVNKDLAPNAYRMLDAEDTEVRAGTL